MKILGKCHCGNISYSLDWPGDGDEIPVRECGCAFCTKHGGTYTSHPQARLVATVRNGTRLSRYRFGTRTAEFFVCSECGAVPFVISEIDNRLYAVVNANTFEDVDRSSFLRRVTDFDGEDTKSRLDRRSRTWIPDVCIDISMA